MEYSRQEYWNWLPCSSPGDLPNPGTELGYPALWADSLPSEPLVYAATVKSLQSSPTLCNQPHRRWPTRLPRPWESPGKNTGMGCHFLLQCMKGKSESEVAQLCPTLRDPMVCSPPGSSVHGIFQARVLEWGAIAFSTPLHLTQYLFYLKSS